MASPLSHSLGLDADLVLNSSLNMKLTQILLTLLLVPLSVLHAADAPTKSRGVAKTAKGTPNVIVILGDDFGYECTGANGGRSHQTPRLDCIAQTGVCFEQCCAQPNCTPTRVQLMTGMSNVRNYVGFGTLEKSQTTFGHMFRDAGYATCIAGKWQLGSKDASLPRHFGFDEHCLWSLLGRGER